MENPWSMTQMDADKTTILQLIGSEPGSSSSYKAYHKPAFPKW